MNQEHDTPDQALPKEDTNEFVSMHDGLCQRILAAIEELTARHSRPPTYREVLAHLGITSHRQLSIGLNELVRTGQLHRLSGARNLIVTHSSPTPS